MNYTVLLFLHTFRFILVTGIAGHTSYFCQPGSLARTCNVATDRLGHRDVRGLCSIDPRLNFGLASALSLMMLTHTSGRPGEPPPPCLGVVKRVTCNFGDKDRPPSCKCDVWLGSMVRTRVRVPAREHRRADYWPSLIQVWLPNGLASVRGSALPVQ